MVQGYSHPSDGTFIDDIIIIVTGMLRVAWMSSTQWGGGGGEGGRGGGGAGMGRPESLSAVQEQCVAIRLRDTRTETRGKRDPVIIAD